MIVAPHPVNEEARVARLEEYGILDTLPEQVYDDITYLASRICDTPIALISLVARERQWYKSKVGLEASETPRDIAFCSHAILEPQELLVVPDATQDVRFSGNPLVTTDPNIRFYAGAPLQTSEGDALGTLCVIDHKARELDEEQLKALSALSRQVMGQLDLRKAVKDLELYQERLEATNEMLAAEKRIDTLTGLSNRGAFDERLDEELSRASRQKLPLTLLLLDVDHFKQFNDEFGHPAGDVVLRHVSDALLETSRKHDFVARFGGAEFAIILPNTGREGAAILGERLRQVIERGPWKQRPVTVSIGTAVASSSCTNFGLIDRADEALYDAKRGGRNRVAEAPPVG